MQMEGNENILKAWPGQIIFDVDKYGELGIEEKPFTKSC